MKHSSSSSRPARSRPSDSRRSGRPDNGGGGRSGARAGETSPSKKTVRSMQAGLERSDQRLPKLTIDLYGHHAVREAILNENRYISSIYTTPDQADLVDEWVQLAQKAGVKRPGIHLPSRAAFDAACAPGAVHQGVGLSCDPLPDVDLDDVLRDLGPSAPAVLVMLDQVTDPHNFGAILRSASAFGAAAVVVQRRNAPDLTALVAKIACGAVDHIRVASETNLSRAIDMVKDHGFTVWGLDERGERTINDMPCPSRVMIVLGAEGDGLRRLVREGCDDLVRLPTQGAIASLNVSNAAAVALYAVCSGAR